MFAPIVAERTYDVEPVVSAFLGMRPYHGQGLQRRYEERFPSPRLSVRCRFREASFALAPGDDRVAPKAAVHCWGVQGVAVQFAKWSPAGYSDSLSSPIVYLLNEIDRIGPYSTPSSAKTQTRSQRNLFWVSSKTWTYRTLLKFLRKPSLLHYRVPHSSSGTLHFSDASPVILLARMGPIPVTSRRRWGSASITSNTFSPNALTIFLA